jgi:CHAD domain-containing protein
MRSGSEIRDRQAAAPLPRGWQLVEAWRELLGECAQKVSHKNVHDLRIVTLRLQSALEGWLKEHPDAEGVRDVKRWSAQGKKLRRALEPVREADVYLERLESLREPVAGPKGRKLQCSRSCLREIGEFEGKLMQQREAAADKLQAAIEARYKRLDRRSHEMEAVLKPHMAKAKGEAEQAARLQFVSLAAEFKDLNGTNLHEYRKRLKKVRYLADTGTDAKAKRLAANFKKMLDAAGEWHDWQMLAKTASGALPHHGKGSSLIPVLGTMAEEALRGTLNVCQHTTARLLKNSKNQPVGKDDLRHSVQIEQSCIVASEEQISASGERS